VDTVLAVYKLTCACVVSSRKEASWQGHFHKLDDVRFFDRGVGSKPQVPALNAFHVLVAQVATEVQTENSVIIHFDCHSETDRRAFLDLAGLGLDDAFFIRTDELDLQPAIRVLVTHDFKLYKLDEGLLRVAF